MCKCGAGCQRLLKNKPEKIRFGEAERHFCMRGNDQHEQELYSYGGLEERVKADHPLRRIRILADAALARLNARFDDIYGDTGRPSIAPEKLLRALLLQVLYSIRSERALMDQIASEIVSQYEGQGEESQPSSSARLRTDLSTH